jgi:16S rRNA (cytosine967-C5)-methyltransferase
MEEKIAALVIAKYLKKGNMARCLRDILPGAHLSRKQREDVADIVHTMVRWRRLFEQIIQTQNLPFSAETFVKLVKNRAQKDAKSYPFEYRFSCSSFVADILRNHQDWAEYLNQTPPTTLCVNYNKSTTEEVISLLNNDSLVAERSVLPTALLTTSVAKYSTVIQKQFALVQDESSQLISFLTAFLGDSFFDYCAGNGGKSLAIGSITRNTKQLDAFEMNEKKRATLKKRCSEYNAQVRVHDVIPKQIFDVVLVDAPCTGLGAARRNPEAKYIDNLGDLPEKQIALLKQTAMNVKSGGFLLYSVCTITPEETTTVIKTFLDTNRFSLESVEEFPFKKYLQDESYGFVTKVPQGDLFFIAVLKKP